MAFDVVGGEGELLAQGVQQAVDGLQAVFAAVEGDGGELFGKGEAVVGLLAFQVAFEQEVAALLGVGIGSMVENQPEGALKIEIGLGGDAVEEEFDASERVEGEAAEPGAAVCFPLGGRRCGGAGSR